MSSSPFLPPSSPARRGRGPTRGQVRRAQVRRRRVVALTLLAVLAAGAAVVAGVLGAPGGVAPAATAVDAPPGVPAGSAQGANGPLETPVGGGLVDLRGEGEEVDYDSRRPPKGGILIDLDSGEVLWQRRATGVRPIASLTKMMTALVATERLASDDRAKITDQVLAYSGSGVGVLPKGKRVEVEALLHGLLLPSGNDAARALALRATGSQASFVERMNEQAERWGLGCTTFASVEGLSSRNRSCPADMAALGRRVLDQPRLARIVAKERAELPFPIEGGRLFLTNNNPLLREDYRGTIGVKTGYTSRAGRCLVAAAERGDERLLVVLLDSYDPGRQAKQLLNRGFKALD